MDRGACWATVHGVTRVRHDWVTSLHFNHFNNLYHDEELLTSRGLYLLFVVLWGWAETAETYLYLSYPFISPSPNTGQPEMLISISNFIFKAWDFGLCASDMLSDSIPSLTRNLKSIPSCSYFLRQSAFCPFNVYFSKKKNTFASKKKSTLTYMFTKCVKIWTGMTKINLKILFPLGRREAGECDQGGKRIHRKS